MKVLIIGNGGREHALAWKAAQSPLVELVYVAPGNAGTHREPKVENVSLDPSDHEAVINFALSKRIELTIVGPEAPLVAGLVDALTQKGLKCFGPTQAAAQLEGSKVFAKHILTKYHLPTARAQSFSDSTAAIAYLDDIGLPVAIKADGLAAGKGVVLAHHKAEAIAAIEAMLDQQQFGEASQQILVEEFLQGEEASFMVITDGENIFPLATSQDHKARDNNDQGPNTGGMGAYSPAPVITPAREQYILEKIIAPTLKGLRQEGICYQGILYAGLMITPNGKIKILEFNCRLGDPEAQVILPRLKNDLVALCLACINGQLATIEPNWDPRVSVGVVMATHNYPNSYPIGTTIYGLNDISNHTQYNIFHAGTTISSGKIVTNGGRVLCITALGDTVHQAQIKAYKLTDKIKWEGAFYRTDIGHRAINREPHGE
jgi:phosphoribosylamine--glycine ligase